MKNHLISIFIVLIVALGILQFLVLPPYEQFMFLRLQLNQKKTELQNQSTHLSGTANLLQELNQNQLALAKISSSLPFQADVPSLFRFVQQKSSETGMILKNIVFQGTSLLEKDEKVNNKIREISFSAIVSGSFPNFVSFLQEIESSSRLFEVTNINLEQEGTAQGNIRDVYSLSLKTNFFGN